MVGEQKLVLELELEQEAQQVLVELACHLWRGNTNFTEFER